MEMSQGNSLCSDLKQTKISLFFFFYKIGKQEGGTGPVWLVGTSVGGRWGKGRGRVNMVQILCIHG
jgi:hypothetical protein